VDDKPDKRRFPKEFLGAFALTFFNEFNRLHHGANIWQALFSAFFTALLLAIAAHITRGKKKQVQWKYFGIFALTFAFTVLMVRQRMGPAARWTEIFSSSLTVAIWICAMLFLISYFWRQAEGQAE